MKILENGVLREATALEIEAQSKVENEMKQFVPEPSPEERIAALEKDNAELREALELLLSGETGVKS